jgi:outer membrane protein OmpA-like peptidoglycan-associated protein
MKKSKLLLTTLTIFSFSACSLNKATQGALAGGTLGAGTGAIIGSATGKAGPGIAIGAALGALGGALVGNSLDSQDQATDQIRTQIADRDRQLEENKRIIEELKRRGVDVSSSDRGVTINFPDVLFHTGSSNLTAGAEQTVRDIAKVLHDIKDRPIVIEGHTDSVGSPSYNQKLSENRADTVARALINEGADRSLVRSKGYGEDKPIASNSDTSGRTRNRRVEVIVENR